MIDRRTFGAALAGFMATPYLPKPEEKAGLRTTMLPFNTWPHQDPELQYIINKIVEHRHLIHWEGYFRGYKACDVFDTVIFILDWRNGEQLHQCTSALSAEMLRAQPLKWGIQYVTDEINDYMEEYGHGIPLPITEVIAHVPMGDFITWKGELR